MIVTSAFFADYARQADQKLDVLGGIWDWCVLPSLAQPVEAHLVVLLQRAPDDGPEQSRIFAEISDGSEDGPLHTFDLPVSGHIDGEQQAVAFPISFVCRRIGRHVLRLTTGPADAGFSLSLDVRSMT